MSSRVTGARPPVRLRDALVLVTVGGALGTALRLLLTALAGGGSGLNGGVVAANVLGACALGWLVARLEHARWSEGRRERLRLFVGVGVLGAFTTYSTFAAHSAGLLTDGRVERAFWQAAALVVLGLVAAGAGMALGARGRTAVSRG